MQENGDLSNLPPTWMRHNPYDTIKNSATIDLVALEKDYLQPIEIPNVAFDSANDDDEPPPAAAPARGTAAVPRPWSPERDSMMADSNM